MAGIPREHLFLYVSHLCVQMHTRVIPSANIYQDPAMYTAQVYYWGMRPGAYMGKEGFLDGLAMAPAPCPITSHDLCLVPSSMLQAAASGSLPRCSS